MSLYFEKFGNNYIVKGDTYRHKEFLKQNGGRWNRYEKGWVFQSKNPIITNYISNLKGKKKVEDKDENENKVVDENQDVNEDEYENEDEDENENENTVEDYVKMLPWLMIVSVIFGIGLGIIWNDFHFHLNNSR